MIEFKIAEARYRFAEASQADCVTSLFDRDWLVSNQLVRGQISTHGRGTVTLLQHQQQDYVLKHYHRGGFIRRFSADKYWWSGLAMTRAWREFSLLDTLWSSGLPCPKPYACKAERQGLVYSASLITQLIPATQTLAERLSQPDQESDGLDAAQWQAVGHCVRQFHDAHFCHADLNADNILLDQDNRVYLIDFDKGSLRKPARSWQFANLKRLRRSLMKYRMEADVFGFGPADWESLRRGYLSTDDDSRKKGSNASR